MTDQLALSHDERAKVIGILEAVLLPTAYQAYAFGSRAKGTHRSYSDLDLLIKTTGPIPRTQLFKLQEAFELSELPFKVDVVDWHRISQSFQNHIKRELILLS